MCHIVKCVQCIKDKYIDAMTGIILRKSKGILWPNMNLHVIIIKIGESYWPYLKKNNFIFISISSSHFQGFEVIQLTRTFVFWRQSLGNEAVKPANLKLVWIVNHILYNFLIYLQKKKSVENICSLLPC